MLLTSRFPFQDLTHYLGTSMRLLPLSHLAPKGGARLLASLDVEGCIDDREEVSRRLEGHPLALRVFAAALARQPHRDPARLITAATVPLHEKVAQLLAFYEASLPPAQVTLLGLVGLFPGEVDLDTVGLFAQELPGAAERLRGWSDEQLRQALDELVVDGLLTRVARSAGSPVYACHPVVRDHFRVVLLEGDGEAAGQAAGLLTGALTGEPETAEQIRVMVHAIRLLLEAGLVAQADELYRERLNDGRLFRHQVLPREGLECALLFVADTRRDRLRQQRSAQRLGDYLSQVGHYAFLAAELELAERYYRDAVELCEQKGDDRYLWVGLRNLGWLLMRAGRLVKAEATARRALALAGRLDYQLGRPEMRRSSAFLAFVLERRGQVPEAVR